MVSENRVVLPCTDSSRQAGTRHSPGYFLVVCSLSPRRSLAISPFHNSLSLFIQFLLNLR
jgi:hypothetical protein